MKKYNSLAVIGTQWGDEGKGKITNYLSNEANLVVRYQGGNNAGHSIVINGKRYALHTIPSGIFNPKIKNVLAGGMVINPLALIDELEYLEKAKVNIFQLFISESAHVVFPYHLKLDALYEKIKGNQKIGTTKKGIGPAYTDKIAREGIRFVDMYDDKLFAQLLKVNVEAKNKIFNSYGEEQISFNEIHLQMLAAREILRPFITNTSLMVYNALEAGKKVLFEGAQGVLLCIDHGTYPFVTSSSPTSSSIPLNVGIPTYMISKTLGVVKAYSTRIGVGGFPTEINDKIASEIREVGNEYGTTTGRPRRIGWFDAVLVRHTARVSGLTDLTITLLDVLTGIKTLKIAISYEINGKKIEYVPAGQSNFANAKPIYLEFPGWKENISQVKTYKDLPSNAKNYLDAIEKHVGVKISQFSVGPDRNQTINIKKLWK